MSSESLWVEKYRPKRIEDCILPKDIKKTFLKFVELNDIPSLLLSGTQGTGKTTVARALCNEMDRDYIMINCSESGNIDTLRTTIRNFASTVSFNDSGKKVVILDEADYANVNSLQPALRGAFEEFANNCVFILTCNYKNRIIQPIHSRCSVIEFKIPKDEMPKLMAQFMKRVVHILDSEGIEYDKAVVAEVIKQHFPDNRRILNELQRYSASGCIDNGILSTIRDVEIDSLIGYMKEKDFKNIRQWVVDNSDTDPTELFSKLYHTLYNELNPVSIPQAILILNEGQYKSAFVTNPEINVFATLIEIMVECEFK